MSSATAVARAAYISTPSVPTTTNTSTSTSTRNLIVFGATPPNPALTWRRRRRRNYSAGAGRGGGSSLRQFPSLSRPFFRIPCHSLNPKTVFTHSRRFSPVMEWQDCTVKMKVDVPISVAYKCYSDREAIPRWMPFISSVKPIPNQKIHWRSMEGLPNRGAVRFYPKGPSSCIVELTVSYEVPQLLTPVASALQPFLQSLLIRGLERFATFAKSY
ncbi:uncharacterized protein LOC107426207 isoform X3 [Ziziphus jujuba]|uniref:Uncharacterized protein LOC107426207 isoform X3 n=1 Tax=Ziziphus jujuba TaxID=326968 RepID=A0ABM3IW58_ZIZJJ|nr:uncharacterized protein LOC107426207 isoform X3 [Ziziphus jujuba]